MSIKELKNQLGKVPSIVQMVSLEVLIISYTVSSSFGDWEIVDISMVMVFHYKKKRRHVFVFE